MRQLASVSDAISGSFVWKKTRLPSSEAPRHPLVNSPSSPFGPTEIWVVTPPARS